ncbi:MAG: phosphopantetheine-binding protein [Jatrophihabitantaceae bacterium]
MNPADIAELFGQLIEVDDFEVEDNFFDLGGTSVLALQVVLEIEKRSGCTLSLIDVVHHPTPDELAAVIAAKAV